MSLTKSPSPPRPRVDRVKVAELLASLVIGHIRERCEAGMDTDNRPFEGYSQQYGKTRAALGRNTSPVDLLMTGGMVGAVQVVERTDDYVVVGVGTGTSSRRRAPTRRRRRKRAGEKRAPPHNLLGEWHQFGAGKNPRRKWFGVSRPGETALRREAARRRPPLLNA